MAETANTIERADLILDELARLGLQLARDLAQQAGAAKDADQTARLAMAFHHVSRSVRQSLALQARLARETRRGAREAREDAERGDKALRARRATQVRSGVRRAIWAEAAEYEHVTLLSRLELALLSDSADDGFLDGPVERHIARLCRTLGIKPAAAPPGPPPVGEGDREAVEGEEPPSRQGPPQSAVRLTTSRPRRPDPAFQSSA